MLGFKKIDKTVRKRGNSLTLSLTKQLNEIGANDKVFVVWSKDFILITKDEIHHPIQLIMGLSDEEWVKFVGFCVENKMKYAEALKKSMEFYIENYRSVMLKIKEILDKDLIKI